MRRFVAEEGAVWLVYDLGAKVLLANCQGVDEEDAETWAAIIADLLTWAAHRAEQGWLPIEVTDATAMRHAGGGRPGRHGPQEPTAKTSET